jgi:FkbM family methyltransferase
LPHEFICFTEDFADYPKGIIKQELPHPGLKGWFNKLALFKPGLFSESDRILYFDLDTLITGNIGDIAAYDGEHARLAPFFANVQEKFAGPQSGVMAWRGGFGAHIWKAFELTGFPDLPGGDQRFLNKIAPKPDLLQTLYPGKIVSFKGCGGVIPEGVSIACFHGLPYMHQVWPQGWGNETSRHVWEGLKQIGGYWWPETDRECWWASFATVARDMEALRPHMKQTRTCIQAGGNVGIYANHLARIFDLVHTFEPDPKLYECLALNSDANVMFSDAALSSERSQVGFVSVAENVGQSHVTNGHGCEAVTIDEHNLTDCDLIYLDIEGYEKKALEGAAETIRRCRPVIVIEENGLSERYGVGLGETSNWLATEFNYQIAQITGRDVILTPNDSVERH